MRYGIAAQEIFDNGSIVIGNESRLRRYGISAIYLHQHCDDLRGCLKVPADRLFKQAQQYRLLTTDLAQFAVLTYGDTFLHKSGEGSFEVMPAFPTSARVAWRASFEARGVGP